MDYVYLGLVVLFSVCVWMIFHILFWQDVYEYLQEREEFYPENVFEFSPKMAALRRAFRSLSFGSLLLIWGIFGFLFFANLLLFIFVFLGTCLVAAGYAQIFLLRKRLGITGWRPIAFITSKSFEKLQTLRW